MAETVTFTSGVQVTNATGTNVATLPGGSHAYTVTVATNRRTFTLAANADDTVLDIADMAAIRFLSVYSAVEPLTLKVGADTAAVVYIPPGYQQHLIWNADVTAVYFSNLDAATAAEVEVVFGK
jgi:hypothetical protein